MLMVLWKMIVADPPGRCGRSVVPRLNGFTWAMAMDWIKRLVGKSWHVAYDNHPMNHGHVDHESALRALSLRRLAIIMQQWKLVRVRINFHGMSAKNLVSCPFVWSMGWLIGILRQPCSRTAVLTIKPTNNHHNQSNVRVKIRSLAIDFGCPWQFVRLWDCTQKCMYGFVTNH